MKNLIKRYFLKIVLVLGLFLNINIGPNLVQASEVDITVGALRFTSHAATFVALERGYFKEEGLNVNLKFFQAAQPMAIAVAAKSVDYAVTAISGGLISLSEKGAIKIIGGALIEESGVDGQKIIVSDKAYNSGLKTPALLDGKSWGITQAGSSFHYMGSKIAEKEAAKINFKPLQKTGAVIGAIKSGQIDAWSIVPHIAKPLAKSGKVHIIGNVADYIPNYQVTVVFTSNENATKKREISDKFLKAFARGAKDFNDALVDKITGDDVAENMVKLIHKYVYTDRPYEKAAPSIKNGAMRISPDATLNLTSVEDQLDWFKKEKLVKDSVTIDMLVDQSYIIKKAN